VTGLSKAELNAMVDPSHHSKNASTKQDSPDTRDGKARPDGSRVPESLSDPASLRAAFGAGLYLAVLGLFSSPSAP
jgi:hypothetical protein